MPARPRRTARFRRRRARCRPNCATHAPATTTWPANSQCASSTGSPRAAGCSPTAMRSRPPNSAPGRSRDGASTSPSSARAGAASRAAVSTGASGARISAARSAPHCSTASVRTAGSSAPRDRACCASPCPGIRFSMGGLRPLDACIAAARQRRAMDRFCYIACHPAYKTPSTETDRADIVNSTARIDAPR
ncbi:hypothetical protein EMIT0111MI5_160145 [Burkholderia sp. IT-111MI5]